MKLFIPLDTVNSTKFSLENTLFLIIRSENDEFHNIKGIVSRDWAGLQMGSLDRSDFPTIPLEVYF
jgi:hypothetical protein